MPTVLELLGISGELVLPYLAPVKHTFPQDIVISKREITPTGLSLLPIVKGDAESIRDFVVTAHSGSEWSIRTEDWSYFLPLKDERKPELYNRKEDPSEKKNIVKEHRDVADTLELTLRRFADEVSEKTA